MMAYSFPIIANALLRLFLSTSLVSPTQLCSLLSLSYQLPLLVVELLCTGFFSLRSTTADIHGFMVLIKDTAKIELEELLGHVAGKSPPVSNSKDLEYNSFATMHTLAQDFAAL